MTSTIVLRNADDHSVIAESDFKQNNLYFALAEELDLEREDSRQIESYNLHYILQEIKQDRFYKQSPEEAEFLCKLIEETKDDSVCEEELVLSVYR